MRLARKERPMPGFALFVEAASGVQVLRGGVEDDDGADAH